MPVAGGKSSAQLEAGKAGELLRAYAAAASEGEATALLDQLFHEYLGRWCADTARRTLRNYGLHGTDRTEEAAEVTAEAMLHMTGRLRDIRHGGAPPIGNLRTYAVTTVYNGCFARIRARCPRYVQLQNRIRYLLRNDRDFAMWRAEEGEQLAGLRTWTGREEHVEAPVPQRSGDSLKEVLRSVFELARAPVRLTDLIGAAADSLGIADNAAAALDSETDLAAEQPAADRVLMERQSLMALWEEVRQLSAPQRLALLLNLRDAGGHGVIELIPATGAATFEELAESLNMTAAALAAVWPELPLEDARIAEMLGLTRQQVINLRKAARERLARRQQNSAGNTKVVSASTAKKGIRSLVAKRVRTLFHRGHEHDA